MITLIFDGYKINWFTKTQSFVFEISEVPEFRPDNNIQLKNPSTGKIIEFELTGKDMDSSNEDIYGWRYKATKGMDKPCTLLAIND